MLNNSKSFVSGYRFIISLFIAASVFAGCEFIGDIFKAGIWVGVVIVLIIAAIIIWIVRRFR